MDKPEPKELVVHLRGMPVTVTVSGEITQVELASRLARYATENPHLDLGSAKRVSLEDSGGHWCWTVVV